MKSTRNKKIVQLRETTMIVGIDVGNESKTMSHIINGDIYGKKNRFR